MAVVIIVGENSWVTAAEADSYLEEKIDASAWASLTDEQKAQRIISAYRWINQQSDLSISASAAATVVKYAQIETAWYMHEFWTAHKKRNALYSQGVRDFTISKYEETLEGAELPSYIKLMLKDYITDGANYFPEVTRTFTQNSGS